MPAHLARPSIQRGFSLLEVLISILVLSFGILGAAGLQASSLQVTREARLQASAMRLAEELGELMRSNKALATDLSASPNPYVFDAKAGDTPFTKPNCGYPTPVSTSPCTTPQDIAQRDLYEWWARVQGMQDDPDKPRVRNELPDARVVICQDSVLYDSSHLPQWACNDTGGTLVVKIGWTRTNTLRGASGTDATTTTGANTGAFDKALRPAIIFPLIPGSTT